MKPAALLFAMTLLIAAGANAQAEPQTFSLFASPSQQTFAAVTPAEAAPLIAVESPAIPPAAAPLFFAPWPNPLALSAPVPQENPGVVGVFQSYYFQLYVGYTFLRFYELPGHQVNTSGLDIDLTYYPGGGVIGAEGNLTVGFGTDMNQSAKFAAGMGGARLRWPGPRAVQIWGHGLVGVSHYLPQTAFGGQTALGYEVGGGVDVNAHHARIAYRFEADMVGTRFFHTYQYSPKFTAGIVFKF
jgi:hypothetical protein